jgi:crotonobetainyl-CoA:carnitine CoA-transferase CaiB-like acyl-CoA transferase
MSKADKELTEFALHSLLQQIGVDRADTGGGIEISGADPIVPSRHRVGLATAAALAAQGAGIAAIWKMRTGRGQDISVDLRRAAMPGLRTSAYLRQNGHSLEFVRAPNEIPNHFKTRDDRRVYLLRPSVYPKHLARLLEFLGCVANKTELIADAVSQWEAGPLEEALAERKLVGVYARTREEWASHPQGKWLHTRPAINIRKIDDSAPEPFRPMNGAGRPLTGIRILDMAHVLAGPVTSRVLAEQGADVLHISSPHHSDNFHAVMDTSFGKRSAYINLDRDGDLDKTLALVKSGDVFIHSWRPGSLDRRGLSPELLAKHRPGIIYVTVSCFGYGGPWMTRGGYEPIGQTVCGLSIEEGSFDKPMLAPTFTLNDYLGAYLAAAGTLGALIRRAREGGSYHVDVSLTRSSMWVQEVGMLPQSDWPDRSDGLPPLPLPQKSDLMSTETAFGTIEHPAPITQYSETKAFWDKPPMPPGAVMPEWLPRDSG